MNRMIFRFRGCDGCRLCELACSLKRHGECKPSASVITILDSAITGMPIPSVKARCECDPTEAACVQVCRRQAIRMIGMEDSGPMLEDPSWVECPVLPA